MELLDPPSTHAVSAVSNSNNPRRSEQGESATAYYKEIRATVRKMENCLDDFDTNGFAVECSTLMAQAERARTLAAKTMEEREAQPYPIAKALFNMLGSDRIEMQPRIQRSIGAVARLFTDLTFLKRLQEEETPQSKPLDELVAQIKRIRSDFLETEVGLRHDLRCAKATLKMIRSRKRTWGGFFTDLGALTLGGDIVAGLERIKKLHRQVNHDVTWITEAEYLNLFGTQLCVNTELLEEVMQTIEAHKDNRHVALESCNTLAHVIKHCDTEEIRERAFAHLAERAQNDTRSRLERTGRRLLPTSQPKGHHWTVRYQAIIHLSDLMDDHNESIRNGARTRLAESYLHEPKSERRVRALLEDDEHRDRMKAVITSDCGREVMRQEESELDQLRAQLALREAELESNQAEFEALKRAREEDIAGMTQEIESQQEVIDGKEAQLAQARLEIEQLEQNYAEATEEKARFALELVGKQGEVRGLEADLQVERTTLDRLIVQHVALVRDLEQTEQRRQETQRLLVEERRQLESQENSYRETIRQMEEGELDAQNRRLDESLRQRQAAQDRELDDRKRRLEAAQDLELDERKEVLEAAQNLELDERKEGLEAAQDLELSEREERLEREQNQQLRQRTIDLDALRRQLAQREREVAAQEQLPRDRTPPPQLTELVRQLRPSEEGEQQRRETPEELAARQQQLEQEQRELNSLVQALNRSAPFLARGNRG